MIPLGVLASAYVAPAGGGAGVEYIGIEENTAYNANPYTLTDVPIGPAATDRILILAVMTRNATYATSVTVGGISATGDNVYTGGNTGDWRVEHWRAAVPTGTTADVVVTWSGGVTAGTGVAVYSITGYTVAVADAGYSTSLTPSTTVTATSGGLIIATAGYSINAGATCAWTGVNEDFEGSYGFGSSQMYSGGHTHPTSAGDVTVSAAYSSAYYPRLAVTAYSLT